MWPNNRVFACATKKNHILMSSAIKIIFKFRMIYPKVPQSRLNNHGRISMHGLWIPKEVIRMVFPYLVNYTLLRFVLPRLNKGHLLLEGGRA